MMTNTLTWADLPTQSIIPDPWGWWASLDAEIYRVGPHATREAVLAEARTAFEGHGAIYIVEARQDPLVLSAWIDFEEAIDAAEANLADSDRVGSDGDEGPWFKVKPDQQSDLIASLKRACDDWQARHGLIFTCSTFSDTRNEERVEIAEATPETGDTGDDPPLCPICDQPFAPSDLCATDITEGTCHAACLDGSPTVHLETGEPFHGPMTTFRYEETDK